MLSNDEITVANFGSAVKLEQQESERTEGIDPSRPKLQIRHI